jgi:2-polyprenyl-6-methoxyphenol hydroxylase-like FAD-dependent oxidoreductase
VDACCNVWTSQSSRANGGCHNPSSSGARISWAALTNGLDDGVLTRSSSCAGIEQDADGVRVRLADGREERAAVAVVADGMTSDVRNAVFGRIEPRYAGYRYLSAVSEHQDASVPPGAFQFILGPGDRFGIHAGHRWSLWFAALLGPPGDGEAREAKKQTLKERFRRFGGAVEGFIDGTDEAAIETTDVDDLDPLERWVSGRVVLIGDAAHASTPNLGRSAGDALEDAVVLADCLADAAGDVTNALARFEQQRREDTSDVQKRARRIGTLNSWKNPLAVAVRERIMRLASGATVKEMKTDFARFAAIADDSRAPTQESPANRVTPRPRPAVLRAEHVRGSAKGRPLHLQTRWLP